MALAVCLYIMLAYNTPMSHMALSPERHDYYSFSSTDDKRLPS